MSGVLFKVKGVPDVVRHAKEFHWVRLVELKVMQELGFGTIGKFNAFSHAHAIVSFVESKGDAVKDALPAAYTVSDEPDDVSDAIAFHQKRIFYLYEIPSHIMSVSLYKQYIESKSLLEKHRMEKLVRKSETEVLKEWAPYMEWCLGRDKGSDVTWRRHPALSSEEYLSKWLGTFSMDLGKYKRIS
ncbi:MAG: hypothetical protein Hyperionvirus1_162 [Hyperionvirus sp.]|uniref:Uncharacterized protein n=1 Tax=Hyperionvirus sp. TaxID=2487770 RepID=A0A3G5A9T6_9VIRU|nr:MAG: hypothetical protein Hyperionvirus1_162 [Hyperionvirus sp.]